MGGGGGVWSGRQKEEGRRKKEEGDKAIYDFDAAAERQRVAPRRPRDVYGGRRPDPVETDAGIFRRLDTGDGPRRI